MHTSHECVNERRSRRLPLVAVASAAVLAVMTLAPIAASAGDVPKIPGYNLVWKDDFKD